MIDEYEGGKGEAKIGATISLLFFKKHPRGHQALCQHPTDEPNKLLTKETDFWRRPARISRKEKIKNLKIR